MPFAKVFKLSLFAILFKNSCNIFGIYCWTSLLSFENDSGLGIGISFLDII